MHKKIVIYDFLINLYKIHYEYRILQPKFTHGAHVQTVSRILDPPPAWTAYFMPTFQSFISLFHANVAF